MNLGEAGKDDFTSQQSEMSIVALEPQIAKLKRRIVSHPDREPSRLTESNPVRS
jgi:hypothetical protein